MPNKKVFKDGSIYKQSVLWTGKVMMKLLLIALILIIPTNNILNYSCTVFFASNDKYIMGGNNEDWKDPAPKMFFYPPENGKYGWIKFGWGSGFPQGGMNEKGLFWDATACCYLEMPESEANKERYYGPLMGKIMEECGSVTDALDVFSNYYCEDQYKAQYLIGDKYGSSVIVEGDSYILKNKKYQVMTNFYQSYPDLCGYPCLRYETANEMLKNNEFSLYLFGSILAATHQEGKYPTQYSNIYDLKNGIIYLFHKHNFEEYIKIDLKEELLKGKRVFDLSSLFSSMEIIGPKSGEKVSPNEVFLKWKGKSDKHYDLYLSEEPDFADCIPVNIKSEKIFAINQAYFKFNGLIFGFLIFGGFISLKKKFLVLMILLLIFITHCSVGQDFNINTDIIEFSKTINNLKSDTEYYWKVKSFSQKDNSFISETVIRTIFTGNY